MFCVVSCVLMCALIGDCCVRCALVCLFVVGVVVCWCCALFVRCLCVVRCWSLVVVCFALVVVCGCCAFVTVCRVLCVLCGGGHCAASFGFLGRCCVLVVGCCLLTSGLVVDWCCVGGG